MGRGPGIWQRVILDTLEQGDVLLPVVSLAYAVRGNPTRSDFVAARRAVRTLAEAGKVRAIYMWMPTRDETRMIPQLVVTRSDSEQHGTVADLGEKVPEWVTRSPTSFDKVAASTRQIAAMMGVSPSTVSRDTRKNREARTR